jgi:hypothetical protein
MRGHWHRKTENARRANSTPCSGTVKWSANINRAKNLWGVMLLGEAKWEAPAQAELRPTCAGPSGVALPLETPPPSDHSLESTTICEVIGIVRQKMRDAQIGTPCSGAVRWSANTNREFVGVTLLGEAKRQAPAQAELRPTCAGPSRRQPRGRLEAAGDQFFQLHDVGREFANPFRSLVDRHRIFVELETKGLFVESDFFSIRSLGDRRVEFPVNWFK